MSQSSSQDNKQEATLGLKTRITFGLLAMLASPLLGLILIWFKMDAIQKDIRSAWTVQHQSVWVDRLSYKNPSLQVPEVSDVIKTMEGKGSSNP